MISEFHFLRPDWLFALLPLAILLMWLQRRRLSGLSWQGVVEPRLLPYLLIGQSKGKKPLLSTALAGFLAVLAMAGPAWQKLEVPVFRQTSALVVLLDLSRSMDAQDVKPSRLQRAQMKLRDLLAQQKEGDTALIVYAATPYVVSPLTSDAKTIASQLASLSTDLMPAQGSRPDRAILLALQLLKQSGALHANVLLISDGLDSDESAGLKAAIKALVDAGHHLSVLGVGSAEGAPIPSSEGGFIKDENGAIVIPKLDDASLAAIAREGGGLYRHLSTDDSDFHALLATDLLARQQKSAGINSDQWRDEGPWLLLPLLLLGALAFRRGYLLAFLLLTLPLPHPAYALDWQGWLQRDDQRGQQALLENHPQQAARLFKDPQWRAAANYRAKNYQAAVQDLQPVDSSDADYNRGNALAQQGNLQAAISAYDAALKRDPANADAKFNRDLLEQIIRQQKTRQNKKDQQGQKNQPDNKKQPDKKEQQDKKDQQNQQAQSQKGKSDQKDQQQDNQSGKSKNAQPTEAEKPGAKPEAAHDKPQADNKTATANQAAASSAQPAQSGGDNKSPANAAVTRQNKLQSADQQWLGRIPDDPGGLWRRKFLYQYKQQPVQSEDKAW